MRQALGAVIFFLFAGAYCTAAIAWSAAVWYLLTTVVHRQPGVRLWSAPLGFFPPNIVFRPTLLTDRGRACRRRFAICLGVFLIALAIGLALSGLARLAS
jgi:hypothetical protein